MNNYSLKQKDGYIQLRLPHELKDQFQATCRRKAINSSELLRQFIAQWVMEQNKDNK